MDCVIVGNNTTTKSLVVNFLQVQHPFVLLPLNTVSSRLVAEEPIECDDSYIGISHEKFRDSVNLLLKKYKMTLFIHYVLINYTLVPLSTLFPRYI